MGFKEQIKNTVSTYLEEAQLKARISTDAEAGMGATISGDPEKAGKRKKTVRIKDLIPFEPDEKMETPEARSNIDRIKKAIQSGKKLPPLVTRNTKKGRQVIDGHHRLKAHKELGTKKVQIARPSKISVEPNMTKIKAREQIKNAVLEYLSPEAYNNRLSQSADMVTKDQANRNTRRAPVKGSIQAGREIDDLAGTRSDRVSRVQRGRRGGGNSRLQRKGFDDKRAVGPNKPRPATLKLGKTLDIEEQFKNAVLKYLDENEEAGRKLTQARQQGRLKPGKLSKEDYEEGHTSHPEALRNRIRQSVANQAGRRASSKETNRLSKHQDIGGSVAAHHLTHGIKKSLEKDPSQGEGSDASKRTIDIAPMRSRRAHPQSGSMAQLDKHQKMARKRGEVAATQSTEDFHAGEEEAGATLNPKQASKAARSRTRTAAGEVRTAKHQAAQGTGAKTTKSSKNPAIRNAVRDEDRNTRDRRNTYGDTKQGYKDSTDFDPMNPFK